LCITRDAKLCSQMTWRFLCKYEYCKICEYICTITINVPGFLLYVFY